MARAGYDTSYYTIIIDGNSLPQQAASDLVTSFDAEYGASNYNHINVAVGGQTFTDMIADMSAQILPLLNRHLTVILIAHEIRNEIKVNSATPAQVLALAQTYFLNVKTAVSSTKTICVLTSASTLGGGDPTVMTTVPTANGLIDAETVGNIDNKIDLYNYDDFSDTTAKPPFSTDGVHYAVGATGRGLYADFIADQTKILYP